MKRSNIKVWEIADEKPYPDWVQQGFEKKIISWNRTPSSGRLYLLVKGCNHSPFQSGYLGYRLIFDGDYQIVEQERFERKYENFDF